MARTSYYDMGYNAAYLGQSSRPPRPFMMSARALKNFRDGFEHGESDRIERLNALRER